MASVTIDIFANDKTSGALGKIGSALSGVLTTASGFLSAQVFTKVADQVVGFAKDSIGAASDLNETLSKTQQLFGDSAKEVIDWAKGAATSLGLAQSTALDSADGFSIFGKAAGLAGNDLVDFSKEAVGLAVDMQSFFNTSFDEASTAIQALFRGETEPIRKYGVLIDDATMRAKALELGIVSTTKDALTPQQKVLAANALLFEQTADAQGDFARTSGGFANQQKIFGEQIKNTQEQLGQIFLPVLTQVMTFLNTQGIPALQSMITWIEELKNSFSDTSKFQGIRDVLGFLQRWWAAYGPQIQESAKQVFDALVTAFETVKEKAGPFIAETLEKLKVWFVENGPLIQEFIQTAADFITNKLIPAFVSMWDVISPIITGLVDLILGLAKTIMQIATGDWEGAWQTIQETVATVVLNIITAINNFFDTIAEFIGTSMDSIRQNWSDNWELFKTIITTVWQNIVDTVNQKIQPIKDAFNAIKEAINLVKDSVSGLIDKFSLLKVPSIFTPGSPTPFEIGMLGISDAINKASKAADGFSFGGVNQTQTVNALPTGGNVSMPIYYQPQVSFATRSEFEANMKPLVEQAVRSMQADGKIK